MARFTFDTTKIKRKLEDADPATIALVTVAGLTATSTFMKASAARRNSKAWAKEVDRRSRMN